MIRYSDLPADLSTIEDYDAFLDALGIAFDEMARVLKPNRYCAIFVADYRIARSRVILPLHADVIALMQQRGFDLFDLYVWRYYRSGGFRPFGAKPYQAMNVHSYILVFHKPVAPKTLVKNRPVRYRSRLIEKLHRTNRKVYGKGRERSVNPILPEEAEKVRRLLERVEQEERRSTLFVISTPDTIYPTT